MPGGKIAFYYGILDTLQLTDDEVAQVMGHEIAHALREHARERMGKSTATRGAIELGAALLGLGGGGRYLADMGGQLLSLKFGRDDESEADKIGLDLSARAGYEPSAGVRLWQKNGGGQQRSPAAVAVDAPGGQDPDQGDPSQHPGRRRPLRTRREADPAIRAAEAQRDRAQRRLMARAGHPPTNGNQQPQPSTRSSQRLRSPTSCGHTECGIGYSCHSTSQPSDSSASREAVARPSGITVSARPWAMKIGKPAQDGLRSAAVVSASGR